MRFKLPALGLIIAVLCAVTAHSHPIPDIPVRTDFRGGKASIQVEIDPRSFTDDPLNEPYLYNRVLKMYTEGERKELQEKAQALIDATVFFEFEPMMRFTPEFTFEFGGIQATALTGDEDPVMLIGTVEVPVPEGSDGYRIIADESGGLSVIFRNSVNGKEIDRFNVLFPGESSFVFDVPEKQ